MASADADGGILDRRSLEASIHSGPRNLSSVLPSSARWERMADLARMSLTTSCRPIWAVCIALTITGASNMVPWSEMSTKVPGSLDVLTNSFILLTRFPVRRSFTVPSVTMTSVAMKASGGIPMSWTTRLYTDFAESPWIVPMIVLPAFPVLMLWYSVRASSPLTSPMIIADSPILRDTRRASLAPASGLSSFLSSTRIVWTLYPIDLILSPGSSMVSSMVRILCERGSSSISAERRELLPAPLGPQIRNVERLLTRNDSNPAERESIVPFARSLVSVHGLTECFLTARA